MKKQLFFTFFVMLSLVSFGQSTATKKSIKPAAKTATAKKPIPVNKTKSPCEVWHGKSFSPNGDGRDEVFLPSFQNCEGTKIEFWIVDHNGKTVFKTDNLNTAWNGMIDNKPAPADKYMWQLRMLEPNNNWMNSMGSIQLVRETTTLANY